MNDKGKTVTSIEGISSSYCRRVKRGKNPARRFVSVKLEFNLNSEFPGDHGYAATMGAIQTVTDRALNACAKEFLP